MPLLIVILGILLLFVLIAKFKLNAFISFIIVCVFVGVFQGMELDRIVEAIQIGMGNTLGFLVMILGLGAMLGKLVSDSGAAQRITSKLVSSFGIKHIQWAVVVAGFIVGYSHVLLCWLCYPNSLGVYHRGINRTAFNLCWLAHACFFIGNPWFLASASCPYCNCRYVQCRYW